MDTSKAKSPTPIEHAQLKVEAPNKMSPRSSDSRDSDVTNFDILSELRSLRQADLSPKVLMLDNEVKRLDRQVQQIGELLQKAIEQTNENFRKADEQSCANFARMTEANQKSYDQLSGKIEHAVDKLSLTITGLAEKQAEAEKPQWNTWISAAALALVIVGGIYGLALNPMYGTLQLYGLNLQKTNDELKELTEKVVTHEKLPVHPVAAVQLQALSEDVAEIRVQIKDAIDTVRREQELADEILSARIETRNEENIKRLEQVDAIKATANATRIVDLERKFEGVERQLDSYLEHESTSHRNTSAQTPPASNKGEN